MTTFWPTLDTPTTRYTVQLGLGFLAPEYLKSTGAQHESIDLNATTGGDSDVGDAVHAADGGTVTAAFWHKGIGGIVLIEHPDGSEAHYWHLRDIHVRKGDDVNGGDLIGQIGKGGRGQWWGHLHFGIRKVAGKLAPDFWPSTHLKNHAECAAFIREHYHEPVHWLNERGAKRRIEDLQAQRGTPTRVLINDLEVARQLVQRSENGVTIDARTETVRVYVNSREDSPLIIPALPPAPPTDARRLP